MVGASDARLNRTAARAARKFASASFSVWLAGSICASSAFSCGSLKSVHQSPFNCASLGCAGFHPSSDLKFSGGASLNAGAIGAEGARIAGRRGIPRERAPVPRRERSGAAPRCARDHD